MTPDGAADGRGLALAQGQPPPSFSDHAARLATARAALRAQARLDEDVARLGAQGEDGRCDARAQESARPRAKSQDAAPRGAPNQDGARSGALDRALGGGLSRAALHEIAPAAAGDRAAAFGFALAVAARLAAGRAILWVGDEAALRETGLPYAPGLDLHGAAARRIVAVRAQSARDAFWALEEATKSGAVGAALGEIGRVGAAYDLSVSRRLALAARAGATPCLLLLSGRAGQADALSSAATTRFEIAAAPSRRAASAGRLPLPGPPRWEARLAKRRGGGAEGFEDIGRRFRLAWRVETGALQDDDDATAVEPRSAASGG